MHPFIYVLLKYLCLSYRDNCYSRLISVRSGLSYDLIETVKIMQTVQLLIHFYMLK